MEIADVKQQVVVAMARAKRRAAERRVRVDSATSTYEVFLERTAVPVIRQLSAVLRAEGHVFDVATPSGSVRLTSDRAGDDYIELSLDTTGDVPMIVGRTSRRRGQRVLQSESTVGESAEVTEQDVLGFLLNELEPFIER